MHNLKYYRIASSLLRNKQKSTRIKSNKNDSKKV